MINKPIYEPRGRAREYGDLALNIYTGCNHGCEYCYAPAALRKHREEFMEVKPRSDIVEAVKKQLEREKITEKMIFLCFTCDPYPAEVDTTTTREIIRVIKNSGNHVNILTKGGNRAVRDFDLLGAGDRFGVTLTGADEKEPNAAPSDERYATLYAAKICGVTTWASFEPVYNPEFVFNLIQKDDLIDIFKIGKLNHAPSLINWAEFGKQAEKLCIQYGRSYYIKDDLRAEMEKAK